MLIETYAKNSCRPLRSLAQNAALLSKTMVLCADENGASRRRYNVGQDWLKLSG
jgi:hypothetical protein